jgi:hypothetical protein
VCGILPAKGFLFNVNLFSLEASLKYFSAFITLLKSRVKV